MAGTVTGRDANLWFVAHSGGASLDSTWHSAKFDANHTHTAYGIGDFSLTLDRGTVEQDLVGEVGNFFDQGALSMDGSLTSVRFGTSGSSGEQAADFLLNLVDAHVDGNYKYLAISGCISPAGDGVTYLSWYLASCQVTGYDISMGDADTITEASIDFTVMDPFNVSYSLPCIRDA